MPFPETLRRAEGHIRALPGGPAMCDRIWEAVRTDRDALSPAQVGWLQIGFDIVYCAGFPARELGLLLAQGDFDVRWPLSFACHYWLQSSGSVDAACAGFLGEAGLWGQAVAVLPEYARDGAMAAWRDRFAPLAPPSPAG